MPGGPHPSSRPNYTWGAPGIDNSGGPIRRFPFRYWVNLLRAYWRPWPTFFPIRFRIGTVWTSQKMGLIIYVSLLLLTPKVFSLPFDPQDNPLLSWAHSYAEFHNQSNCWSVECSPLHQWKASRGGHLHFKEKTLQICKYLNNNHMWRLFLNWWHLTALRWTDVTMDIMWLFILIKFWLNKILLYLL